MGPLRRVWSAYSDARYALRGLRQHIKRLEVDPKGRQFHGIATDTGEAFIGLGAAPPVVYFGPPGGLMHVAISQYDYGTGSDTPKVTAINCIVDACRPRYSLDMAAFPYDGEPEDFVVTKESPPVVIPGADGCRIVSGEDYGLPEAPPVLPSWFRPGARTTAHRSYVRDMKGIFRFLECLDDTTEIQSLPGIGGREDGEPL